jgi:hypothetical protein
LRSSGAFRGGMALQKEKEANVAAGLTAVELKAVKQ